MTLLESLASTQCMSRWDEGSWDPIVGNLKLKEKEFTVTEYAVIERNPKTENSYRILRVPKW